MKPNLKIKPLAFAVSLACLNWPKYVKPVAVAA